MENQEILILEEIKNQKENPTPKMKKTKRKGGKQKSHCQKNSTIK